MLKPAEYGRNLTAPSAPRADRSPAINPSAMSGHSSRMQIAAGLLRISSPSPNPSSARPMARRTTPTSAGSAVPSPRSGESPDRALPRSQHTATVTTVSTNVIVTWTIGLASKGRSRSGIAANVGRIVLWANSLVTAIVATTPSSIAVTMTSPPTSPARSSPAQNSSANAVVRIVTTSGKATATSASTQVTVTVDTLIHSLRMASITTGLPTGTPGRPQSP